MNYAQTTLNCNQLFEIKNVILPRKTQALLFQRQTNAVEPHKEEPVRQITQSRGDSKSLKE